MVFQYAYANNIHHDQSTHKPIANNPRTIKINQRVPKLKEERYRKQEIISVLHEREFAFSSINNKLVYKINFSIRID